MTTSLTRGSAPWPLFFAVLVVFASLSAWVWPQAPKAKAPPRGETAPAAQDLKSLTQGSVIKDLTTSDGVYLTARYWTPAKPGRDTPAVILLHMRGRTQSDWYPFAAFLRDLDCAVVTFDFRGHGESRAVDRDVYQSPKELAEKGRQRRRRTTQAPAAERRRAGQLGEKIEQKVEFVSGRDIRYFLDDLDAIKEFLVEQNNAEKLNLSRMGIVAAGDMACNVALHWLAETEPRTGGRGPFDINALVLVSPSWGYKGFPLPAADVLGEGDAALPILLVCGDAGRSRADAEKMARAYRLFALELESPPDQKISKEDKKTSKQTTAARLDFYREGSGWFTVPGKGEGTELFRPPIAKVDERIAGFLVNKLIESARGLAWEKRSSSGAPAGFGSRRPVPK
jgi:pimeloyl-ACP methyl ester carboxylesterase